MRYLYLFAGLLLGSLTAIAALPLSAQASTETYEEYLSRLRDICAVDCMQPRQFQRTARKRGNRSGDEAADMAIIMDVAFVQRAGDKFELHNSTRVESSFDTLFNLESAGINTSNRNGVGGLARTQRTITHPNVIVIEMDEQTLFDILNTPTSASQSVAETAKSEADIVVEEQVERDVKKPSLSAIRAHFKNRRVVVRGQTRLEATLVGARRDFRRKQVFLEVDNADDIVLLPRFDDDGNPIIEDAPFAVPARKTQVSE